MLGVRANRSFRYMFAAQMIVLWATGFATVALGLLAWQVARDDEQQQKDQRQCQRHHDGQPHLGAFQIFILHPPPRRIALRQGDRGRPRRLHPGDPAAQITPGEIDEDVDGALSVLGADRGGTPRPPVLCLVPPLRCRLAWVRRTRTAIA